jgi:very-short-patch-repair endonuclease
VRRQGGFCPETADRDINRKHNPDLTSRAKELRKSMTKQERKLWHLFLKDYPVRFLRQKVIDRFIVDFYCASAKLVVELDGGQRFEEDALVYDSERTAVLEKFGLMVMRFTNKDIDVDFKSVCEVIDKYISLGRNPP